MDQAWRRVAWRLAFAVALGLRPSTASAHANLVRSSPAVGATVAASPTEIVLAFSEPLDPSFSRASLANSADAVVAAGPGQLNPASPTELRLAIPSLVADSYTVKWRVRSAVDGHITEGNVPFGVGTAAVEDLSLRLPPAGSPAPTAALPAGGELAWRWLSLLTLTLATGAMPFAFAVWRPAVLAVIRRAQREGQSEPVSAELGQPDAEMGQFVTRLTQLGCVLLMATNLVLALQQASTAAGVPMAAALGSPFVQILGGWWGRLSLVRIGLAIALAWLAGRLPAPALGSRRPWLIAYAIGLGMMLSQSLSSHAAALPGLTAATAVTFDFIHLAALGAWTGGWLPLFVAARLDGSPLTNLVPRFTRLAERAVVALLATGLYATWEHVGRLGLLTTTTYGRALVAKVSVFAVLVVLGAFNRLWLTPRLRLSRETATQWLKGTLALELALGVAALVAAGALTSVAPSRSAWEAERQLGISRTSTIDGANLDLWITPGRVGTNAVVVDVRDPRPPVDNQAPVVLLRLTRPDGAGAPLEVATSAKAGDGDWKRYVAQGNLFTTSGEWTLDVIVRHPGMDDLRMTFKPRLTLTGELADAPPGAGSQAAADPKVLALGATLFAEKCAACHGSKGLGDGPAAVALTPPPANMRIHVPLHGDRQLAEFINNGIPKTAMPSFKAALTADQVGALVAYLRQTFGD